MSCEVKHALRPVPSPRCRHRVPQTLSWPPIRAGRVAFLPTASRQRTTKVVRRNPTLHDCDSCIHLSVWGIGAERIGLPIRRGASRPRASFMEARCPHHGKAAGRGGFIHTDLGQRTKKEVARNPTLHDCNSCIHLSVWGIEAEHIGLPIRRGASRPRASFVGARCPHHGKAAGRVAFRPTDLGEQTKTRLGKSPTAQGCFLLADEAEGRDKPHTIRLGTWQASGNAACRFEGRADGRF